MSSMQDSPYANESIGAVVTGAELKRKVEEERITKIADFQKASFPIDPVLLYELQVTSVDGRCDVYYAVPKEDMLNPEKAQELVWFDIIQGDGLAVMSFVNCSITFRKVVFCNIDEIRPTTLMVFDQDMTAYRASKVLRGLPGIANKA